MIKKNETSTFEIEMQDETFAKEFQEGYRKFIAKEDQAWLEAAEYAKEHDELASDEEVEAFMKSS